VRVLVESSSGERIIEVMDEVRGEARAARVETIVSAVEFEISLGEMEIGTTFIPGEGFYASSHPLVLYPILVAVE
jgi:hypothetical protein